MNMYRVGARWAILGGLVLFELCTTSAYSGAWLPAVDENQIIFSTSTPYVNDKSGLSFEYYAARGINDKTALIITKNVKFSNTGFALSQTSYDAQILLHKYKGIVISSRFGISSSKNSANDKISNSMNADMLLGFNAIGGIWVNYESGFRDCFGQTIFPNEITIGKHINKNNMLFTKFGNSSCEFNTNNYSHQLSYVRNLSDNVSIEFGVRTKNYGRLNDISILEHGKSQNSVIFSLWKKY